MTEPDIQQIRSFRLRSHHLDAAYEKSDILRAVSACGMQNTPPGAWETALFNRVPDCSVTDMEQLLYKDRSLLQAWSIRGIPLVFPASESDVFLSALIPAGEEPWIYTQGIGLALDHLQMTMDELMAVFLQVMPRLDHTVIVSKSALDQTIAGWMRPLLPDSKQDLWDQPSMYGHPDVQTVGGAVVSFLLRPGSFRGLVVFGQRDGSSQSFTSLKSWTGRLPQNGDGRSAGSSHSTEIAGTRAAGSDGDTGAGSSDSDGVPPIHAMKELVRRYLHCYGPATAEGFAAWLGCSGKQARRMWKTLSEEMEPVMVFKKKAFILAEDRDRLFSTASFNRELLLLGGHDPYLDQRDRLILQPDKSLHRQIWRLVSNPGAIVYRGEIMGIWNSRKKGQKMEVTMTLWGQSCKQDKELEHSALSALAEEYAAFRRLDLSSVQIRK